MLQLTEPQVITPASCPPSLNCTGENGLNQTPKRARRTCQEGVLEIQLKAFSSEKQQLQRAPS